MLIIKHRINTSNKLKKVSKDFGFEIDLRSNGNEIYLQHDPFKKGEPFAKWIKSYNHKLIVLNVKEEGLEEPLIELMYQNNIDDYFFLDQSFPFLRKTALMGEKRCAVRVSEYENIETALSLSGLVDWIWVDCFNHFPLNNEDANRLINAGFKLCIVSPELQGRSDHKHIKEFRSKIELLGINGNAVCTKYPDLWA